MEEGWAYLFFLANNYSIHLLLQFCPISKKKKIDLVDRKMYQHLGYHISFSRSIIIKYIFIIQFYINGPRYFTEEEPRLVKFLKQSKCTVTTYTFNTMVAPSF